MLYKYILDDSIKSPTLILTADHLTLLFLPGFFFLPKKELPFLLWVNLYMIMGLYLHDPPPFNGPFFMTPPFSELESQKVVTLPLFPPPLPPAIKFLTSPLGSTYGTPSESDVAPVSLQSRTYSVMFGTWKVRRLNQALVIITVGHILFARVKFCGWVTGTDYFVLSTGPTISPKSGLGEPKKPLSKMSKKRVHITDQTFYSQFQTLSLSSSL